MTICGIYKIENLITHHVYIGQSVDIISRWRRHKDDYKKGEKDYPLYQAIRKYGIENFSFEVIEECLRSQLDEREQYWIKYYDSYYNGYNQTLGGQGASGHGIFLNKETVSLIRQELLIGEKTNSEIGQIFGVSENTISGINTGYYWREDDIDYPIRKTNIYKTNVCKVNALSKETRYCSNCGEIISFRNGSGLCRKCASILKRKVARPSKEELFSFLIQNQGNFTLVGRHFGVSDNTIRKWCKRYNIPYHSADYISKKEKKIKQPLTPSKPVAKIDKTTNEILETYSSIYEAEKQNKISHIGQVCSGKRQTSGGYKWKYLSETDIIE